MRHSVSRQKFFLFFFPYFRRQCLFSFQIANCFDSMAYTHYTSLMPMDFVKQGQHWNCYFNGTLKRFGLFFLFISLFLPVSLLVVWFLRNSIRTEEIFGSYILRLYWNLEWFSEPVSGDILRGFLIFLIKLLHWHWLTQ